MLYFPDRTAYIGTFDSTSSPNRVVLDGSALYSYRSFADAVTAGKLVDGGNVYVTVVGPSGFKTWLAVYNDLATDDLELVEEKESHGTIADAAEVNVWATGAGDFLRHVPLGAGYIDTSDVGTPTIVEGTRTVSIAPVSGSFEMVCDGKIFTISSQQDFVIPDVEGPVMVYFDGDGALASTAAITVDLIKTKTLVAFIYWDATNNEAVRFLGETHGRMDKETHAYLHEAFSARLIAGADPSGYTVSGNGDTDSDCQLALSSITIRDEDIRKEFTDGSPQDLTPILSAPILYRSGSNGDWRAEAASNFPVAVDTGRALWNEDTGATWQQTECTNNDFVLAHLFVSTDTTLPVFWVMGQDSYSTEAAARDGAEVEAQALSMGQMSTLLPEVVLLHTWIVQTSTTYSNAVKSRFRPATDGDYVDWRVRLLGFGGVPAGSSSGLTTSTHTLTTGDLELSVDNIAQIDGSGITADRNITLPTGGTAGQMCGFFLTEDNPVAYELVLKGDTGVTILGYDGEYTATEATKFFIKGESPLFMSNGDNTWMVLRDGRIASKAVTHRTTNQTLTGGSVFDLIELPADESTSVGSILDSTNDIVVPRRMSHYLASITVYLDDLDAGRSGNIAIVVDHGGDDTRKAYGSYRNDSNTSNLAGAINTTCVIDGDDSTLVDIAFKAFSNDGAGESVLLALIGVNLSVLEIL